MLAYQDMEYIEQVSCCPVSVIQPSGWVTCLRCPTMDMHSLLCSCSCLRWCSRPTLQLEAETGSRHASQSARCWGSSQSNCFRLRVAW